MALIVPLQFTSDMIFPGPSTLSFLIKYETLFDKTLHYKLRKGAPLLQVLEAPDHFIQGSAEPWIVDVLCALLKASDQRSVLETGAFVGATTLRLAQTLVEMGGGKIVACEIDPARAAVTQANLEAAALPPTVEWSVVQDDVFRYLASVPNESIGFVWVDDAHEKPHVHQELQLLIPKMVHGGLITGHDVYGTTDLQEIFKGYGGYALDLPRIGPAGGIGLLQVL